MEWLRSWWGTTIRWPRSKRLFGEPAIWLAFASAANTLSVAAQGWWKLYTRLFGSRDWVVHAAVIVPGWVAFLASVRSIRPGQRGSQLGFLVEVFGAGLVGLGFRELGPAAAINGDLFGLGSLKRPPGGIFRVLDNPIYTGYALLLFGRALRLGSARLAITAVESLLLLNAIEARVENRASELAESH